MQNLNDQAQEVLKIAEKHGVEQNFFFITTFKRYLFLLKKLEELEQTLKNTEGVSIERTYVKGAKNQYVHPALSAYNKTNSEATKTASFLVSLILKLRDKSDEDDYDPLLDFLSGKKPIPK